MQKEVIIRICGTCNKPLPWSDTGLGQQGWLCCDEYYCTQECLDASFERTGQTWKAHFEEEGECYWTAWELEE